MSVIIAVRKNNKIAMAADSLISVGDNIGVSGGPPKIVLKDNIMIGHCGTCGYSVLFTDIIFDFLKSQKNCENLCSNWASYCIENKNSNLDKIKNESIPSLVFYNNHFYELHPSGSCFEPYDDFWAVGSGKELALGAAYSIFNKYKDSLSIAKIAIEAANKFCNSCEGPVISKTLNIKE